MNELAMLADNLVVWSILLCALCCYSLIFELLLSQRSDAWLNRCRSWQPVLQAGISALPLLGLLGTIVGLLETFGVMAVGIGNHQALMSGGIADALFTTEMGLVMAVPGWILLSQLGAKMQAKQLSESLV